MKKYHLKKEIENGLVIICMSNNIFDILDYVRLFIDSIDDLVKCSVWMDGKVLK